MRPVLASLLTTALLLPLLGCGQEPEPASLLRIEDRVFEMRDFRDHLRRAHPTVQPPIERLVLNRILEEFKERKLLAYAAAKAGVGVPRDAESPFERETALIGRYLAQEAYKRLQIDEEGVESLYRERYVHPRINIRSVLLPDETTARNVYSRLRRNRSRFEQYQEEYSQELVERGVGQGIHSIEQLPDVIKERIAELEEPGLLEPIDVGEGFLVLEVLEFLQPPSLEEVRAELEEQVAAVQRQRLRGELIDQLGNSLEVEFNKDIAFNVLTTEGMQEGEQL